VAEERVIKKYANRRLYDAAASRHVTLDDIKDLIVKGEKVKVLDDKSGEDITRSILLQIIADQEQLGQPILSTQVLEALVRFYGNSMQGFMSRYIDQGVHQFLHQQQTLQAQFARLVGGTPFAQLNDFAQSNLAIWQQMQETFMGAANKRGAASAASAEHGAHNDPNKDSGAAAQPEADKRSRKRRD
jgi:polyhydroxyalkanoate synthesis repressor PhaR